MVGRLVAILVVVLSGQVLLARCSLPPLYAVAHELGSTSSLFAMDLQTGSQVRYALCPFDSSSCSCPAQSFIFNFTSMAHQVVSGYANREQCMLQPVLSAKIHNRFVGSFYVAVNEATGPNLYEITQDGKEILLGPASPIAPLYIQYFLDPSTPPAMPSELS